MGLDIRSKSKNEYHFGYGGIHYIRFYAYKICEGEKNYSGFMEIQRNGGYDWGFVEAFMRFPNLMYHSDCEGDYTAKGKIAKIGERDWITGNSIELLKELEIIKSKINKIHLKDEVRKDSFRAFYSLVKDVVKNHDGKIIFH